MSYVGNTALSPQIQERIQNTFEQTLGLAEDGNRQEALLGCDFILRLDPLFEPARRLQERLDDGEGPVDVGGLTGGEAPQAAEAVAPVPEVSIPEDSVDIGELIADAPDEDPIVGDAPVEDAPVELVAEEDAPPIALTPAEEMSLDVEPTPETSEADDSPAVANVATRMAMLLEQRSFQDLMALAMENQDQITDDQDLQQMVGLANERMEAEPYVRNFLESAQLAKDKGDLESAGTHLEKARELDPSHPDLPGLEADIDAASKVEPPAAFEPPPTTEVPLEDVPPLIDPTGEGDDLGEVDEFFASVEEPAAAAVQPEETTTEPETEVEAETEPDIAQPIPVPSLDAEPAARLDSESEQRIEDLINEGQESFEDGQYQTAIDAWSRIFLIDIDHAEASRRIELARKLKAEIERQTEEAFHEGITWLESGDQDKAKETFNKVLEMQPNHMGARDYLEKIEAGDLSATGPAQPPELTPVVETALEADTADTDTTDYAELTPTPTIESAELDDFGPVEPVLAPAAAPRRRSFVLIGAAVLILVLAVGWFVWSNWERFFPASQDDDATAQTQASPLDRARQLHEAGNTAMAINILRRLPPGSEEYAEAQTLIASWETGDRQEEEPTNEPSEEILALRAELLNRAGQAFSRGENLLTLGLLEQATEIQPLSEDEGALRAKASVALDVLKEERDLFDQGDWEYALPALWRMYEANPENPDVIRLMMDSYYNLGLRDLQRGDAKSALEKFAEAQELSGGDADLDRLAEFAAAYSQRSADMLYRIFVKYQRFR